MLGSGSAGTIARPLRSASYRLLAQSVGNPCPLSRRRSGSERTRFAQFEFAAVDPKRSFHLGRGQRSFAPNSLIGGVLCSRACSTLGVTARRGARMKVLLVDDHELIRAALRGVLKDLIHDAAVMEAADSHQAMQLVEAHPDLHLILLDLNLPDRDGFAVLADLRRRYATISLVVLSAFHDRDNVIRALDLGALGFVPKSASREVMVNALRLVLAGGIYIPPEALVRAEPKEVRRTGGPPISPYAVGLTERQVEVLGLMIQGKSNKVISRMLGIAEPTVKHHISAILKALKVINRTEAVIAVGELGWDLSRPSKA